MSISISSTPIAACATGGPATGKTAWLVRRACELEADGGVLVVCAAEAGARDVRGRLAATGACDVRVCTALELACTVLDDAAVQERRGGPLRVLDAFEEAVLFEDAKTSGCKRGRLRELLLFLERGWSDLLDDDPAWIQTGEERLVLELLQQCLSFSGGVLEAQAANLAVRELLADGELRARHGCAHVLADDYGLMGRASQVLANLLAERSVAVTADLAATLPVGDKYPYAAGIEEFLAANPQAKRVSFALCHAPAAIAGAINTLRSELGCEKMQVVGAAEGERGAEDAAGAVGVASGAAADVEGGQGVAGAASAEDSPVAVFMEKTLVDELRRVARLVQGAIETGISPDDILVIGTNSAWRANAARAIASCGVPVRTAATGSKKMRFESCGEQRRAAEAARVLERLARDEADSIAWRTWCGLDDALARSAALASLRRACEGRGLRLARALELLDAGELDVCADEEARFASLLAVYREGRRQARELAEAGCGSEFGRVSASSDVRPLQTAAAPSGARSVRQDCFSGRHGEAGASCFVGSSATEGASVLVGGPSAAFAREARLVVFGGFVNGLIPSRDYFDPTVLVGAARERAHRADMEAVILAAAAASERLAFTGFTSCGLETAERLKLRIARIRLQDGVRTATTEPSDLLQTMGLATS